MRTIKRILLIICLAIAIGIGWRWIGLSNWSAGLDVPNAGEQFTNWIEPIALLTGWLLISIPAVILTRMAWTWINDQILDTDPQQSLIPSQSTKTPQSHQPSARP